jgi:hypothetical protein
MGVAWIDRETQTCADADVYRAAGHEIATVSWNGRTIATRHQQRHDQGEAGQTTGAAFACRAWTSLVPVSLNDGAG